MGFLESLSITRLKNIIFDLDGVLVDSEALHTESKIATLAHFGLVLPPSVCDDFIGRTDADFFSAIKKTYPQLTTELRPLIEEKTKLFIQLYPKLQQIPGSADFVKLAHNHGLKLGVVTSATELSQTYAFDVLKITQQISTVVNARHVTKHKPDPEPYLFAKEAMAVKPNESFVIEDSVSGIRSASAAGFSVVGLATSETSEVLLRAGSKLVVRDYEELKFQLGW